MECADVPIYSAGCAQIKIEGGGMVPVGGGPSGRMHLSASQQAQHAQQHAAQQAAQQQQQQQQMGAGGMTGSYRGLMLPASNGYGGWLPLTPLPTAAASAAVMIAAHFGSV